jgi:hypothetical protein
MEGEVREICPIRVYTGSFRGHQCTKPVWKDGYCKIHHPESVKSRAEKSRQRRHEQWENNPLNKALKRIKELEEERDNLIKECEKYQQMLDAEPRDR